MSPRRPALKKTPVRPASKSDSAELKRTLKAQADQLAALTAQVKTLTADRRRLKTALAKSAAKATHLKKNAGTAAEATRTADQVEYLEVVRRIHEATRAHVPKGATIIVIGKAERELISLPDRTVWRFPQSPDGEYAGYYPACSTSAIVHLEAIRSKGAGYLLIPEISRWWLEHYVEFANHVRRHYPCVLDEPGVGLFFSLRPAPRGRDAWQTIDDVIERIRDRGVAEPAILDWNTGLNLVTRMPQQPVFSPPSDDAALPYLDSSVDIVAIQSPKAGIAREALRVAQSAVLTFAASKGDDPAAPSVKVTWKSAVGRTAPPSASIVIPCFNGMTHTDACLTALRETLPEDFEGEIIIVDDASDKKTAAGLKAWSRVEPRIRVLRNQTNLGFLRSANRGASAATGEILIFLNNDTIPVAGWLQPLLRVFRERPDAGAAGGRLIYPSGRLQEAGGVVFRDGSAANFGRDDHNPDLPMYRVFRQVDYCSAALLATPRATFEALNGFDLQYEPGYYEDTDYCFRLREKGYRVFLQPESVVIHNEGGTAGLDVSVGMKRYQVVNQEKFRDRWRDVLESQADRPDRMDFVELHALAGRYALQGGGA